MDSALLAYSDARTEYTKQLCQTIVPAIMRLFLNMLQESKEATRDEPRKVLWHFQTQLSSIPDWNMDKVTTEIERLESSIGCEYLEDLITAVFIAHTKILTAIRMNNKQAKIQITVPKLQHFLFKAIIETSKIFWKSTYLFRDDVSNVEKQQNYRQIEGLVNDGVAQAVRCMVPVKSILRDCIAAEGTIEEEHSAAAVAVAAVAEPVAEPVTEPVAEPVAEDIITPNCQDKELSITGVEEADIITSDYQDTNIVPELDIHSTEDEVVETEPVSIPEPDDGIVEEVMTIVDDVEDEHVKFAEYNTIFDEGDSELILEEQPVSEFTEYEDLDAPVGEPVPIPFDDYETLS